MSETQTQPDAPVRSEDFPVARVGTRRRWASMAAWMSLPLLALAVTVGVLLWWHAQQGPIVRIAFEHGHGLKPGDALRHHGIQVGQVEATALDPQTGGVRVDVRLHPDAEGLAREGSRFWIVRPEVSLSRVRGLETVIGARYLQLLPGPPDAPRRREFVGLEHPPVMAETAGGKEITIRFNHGHGLGVGDPLKFRGIKVGEVHAVGLAKDLASAEVHIRLLPQNEGLARVDSRFWIERPIVSLGEVRGLGTTIRGVHVGVLPGAADSPPCDKFVGLDQPPRNEQEAIASESGVALTVRFHDGRGLAAGDPLKFRGIVLGEVMRLELSEKLEQVEVEIHLHDGGSRLARAGSMFWIERPKLSLGETRGLDTTLKGRYVGVIPGAPDAPRETTFQGLEEPPYIATREEGGLDIVLESKERYGLDRGAPVLFRGVPIGHVEGVRLASDSARIVSRVYIRPAYRNLVRTNSRFWKVNRANVDFSLWRISMDLNAESLDTFMRGGVSMATPDHPGDRVATGHRFELHGEMAKEWGEWRPQIPTGIRGLPPGMPRPRPMWGVLSWRRSAWWGVTSREEERRGWLLPVEGGGLLGVADLLTPPESALKQTKLALGGREFVVSKEARRTFDSVPLVLYDHDTTFSDANAWPRERMRRPGKVEDCLVFANPDEDPLALATGRLQPQQGTWQVDPSVSFDPHWHGAGVVSRADGLLIGLLRVEARRGTVLLLPAALTP